MGLAIMTSAASNVMAIARNILDRALAAENGIRIPYTDEKYGSSANAKQEAQTWVRRMGEARTHMRKVQARMASPVDHAMGMSASASDPDVFRTAYDVLSTSVMRDEEGKRWVLTIERVDLSALNVEEF